ncbi:MAG: zinc ribbon domain-containing protein [Thermoplasmata archaeon]
MKPQAETSDIVKCLNCGAEIPGDSRYCLRCGIEVPGKAIPQHVPDPDKNPQSMILFALSFAMFFFSLIPIIMGYWDGALLMVGAGVVLIIIAFLNMNASRRHAEIIAERMERTAERMQKAAAEMNAQLKCPYCGALNPRSALRCGNCGATL